MTIKGLKAVDAIMKKIDDLIYDLEAIRDDEQDTYYNSTTNTTSWDQDVKFDSLLGNIEDAMNCLDEAVEFLHKFLFAHD